jgi:hypothetical protein
LRPRSAWPPKGGFSKEELDELTVRRYEQYEDAARGRSRLPAPVDGPDHGRKRSPRDRGGCRPGRSTGHGGRPGGARPRPAWRRGELRVADPILPTGPPGSWSPPRPRPASSASPARSPVCSRRASRASVRGPCPRLPSPRRAGHSMTPASTSRTSTSSRATTHSSSTTSGSPARQGSMWPP